MKKQLSFLILLLVLPVLSMAATRITNGTQQYDVFRNAQLLRTDTATHITINELLAGQYDTAFHPMSLERILPKEDQYVYWLKADISNETEARLFMRLNYVGITYASFYEAAGGSLLQSEDFGTLQPVKQPYKNSLMYFELKVLPGATHTVYIRLKGIHTKYFPLSCSASGPIISEYHRNDLFYGLVYGFFLIIVFYNLMLYVRIRDKDSLVYAAWVFFLTIQLAFYRGHVGEFLWPGHPFMNGYNDAIAGLSGMAHVLFTITFLKLWSRGKTLKYLSGIFLSLYTLSFLVGALGLGDRFYPYLNPAPIALVEGIFDIAAGIYVYRKGFRPAIIYTLANIGFFICVFILFFYGNALIAPSMFAYNSLHIGAGCEVTLFSLALSFKINLLKKEKDEARQEQIRLLKENESLILNQNRMLEEKVTERTLQLSQEKEKSDQLLKNILPVHTAEELKNTGRAQARKYDEATILFADVKGFTFTAEKLMPEDLVNIIDFYFRNFDRIVEEYGLEKIKTIGDAYMAAGGLPDDNKARPADVVRAAIAMQRFAEEAAQSQASKGWPPFSIRVGIHTGPVVAGVVGTHKFAYDIWGDTVNLASRMEQSGEPGKVNISGATFAFIKEDFECHYRGKIEAKNKGELDMYFVEKERVAQPILA